jgi:hypothetical protein
VTHLPTPAAFTCAASCACVPQRDSIGSPTVQRGRQEGKCLPALLAYSDACFKAQNRSGCGRLEVSSAATLWMHPASSAAMPRQWQWGEQLRRAQCHLWSLHEPCHQFRVRDMGGVFIYFVNMLQTWHAPSSTNRFSLWLPSGQCRNDCFKHVGRLPLPPAAATSPTLHAVAHTSGAQHRLLNTVLKLAVSITVA